MLLAGIVVLAALLFGLAQTPFGRGYLAELAGRLASGNGLEVRISGLTGFVPQDLRVERIVLSDPKGRFAEIDDLTLRWDPLALLSGTVSVQTLEARRVAVLRAPELPPAPSAASEGGLPALRVVVDRLAVPDIALSEPVLGSPARFGFEGGVRLMEPARGLSMRFDLERRDAEGRLTGTVRYAPEGRQLDVDLTGHEPPGGVLARLARLEGLPAIDASIKGSGTLDDWRGTLAASAGVGIHLDGTAAIAASGDAHVVTLALNGAVAPALPEALAPLFEGETALRAEAQIGFDLALDLRRFVLTAAGASVEASGSLTAARVADLAFAVTLGDAARFSALAPDVTWAEARLSGTLRGTQDAPVLAAMVTARDVAGHGYAAGTLQATAATAPAPAGPLDLSATVTADRLSARDPGVAQALGTSGTVSVRGIWQQGAEPTLTQAEARLAALDVTFAGRASQSAIRGTLDVTRLDLAAFAPLAGRPLKGIVAVKADVTRTGADGAIALAMTGTSQGLSTGEPALDGVAGGDASFSGGLSYGPDGSLAVRDLKAAAPGATLAVDGRIDPATANLKGILDLPDLKRLDPRLEGAARAQATFSGRLSALDVAGQVAVPHGAAMGRPIRDLALDFTASDLTGRLGATARLSGMVGEKPAKGSARLTTAADGTRAISDLDFAIGSARLTGNLSAAPTGRLAGSLAFSAANLSDIAPLVLDELAGRAEGTVILTEQGRAQSIAVKARLTDVVAAGQSVAAAQLDFAITDPRSAAAVSGTVEATGIAAGATTVERLRLVAAPADGATRLTLDATAQGAAITATGRAVTVGDAPSFRLETLRVTRQGVAVALSAPATITYRDGTAILDRLALTAGGGTITLQGRIGQTIEATLDARGLPLSLADLAQPGLGLSGTLAATARITGTPTAPNGRYDVTVTRLTSADIARAGAGPFDIRVNGNLADGRAGVNAAVSGPALSGVAITGSVPVSGGALDLAARGTISLAIANAVLATSGARASGNAGLDVTVRGTLDAPRVGGTIRITNGRFEDAPNGVTIERIEAVFTGTDQTVTISSFRAGTPNGGTIQASGSVALDPAGGFPGRIEVTLTNATLVNSELIRFVTDGRATISGPFATRPTIAGRIDVRSLDIHLPDRLPGGSAANLNVRHVNLPPGVNPATPRARREGGARSAGAFVATLDLTVSAPNRIFVRGMGMDAELGGTLQVRGTSAEPVTDGGFQMLRGRLDILGRRLDFTRGRLTFNGSTDPDLDFIAESAAGDVTARILITGKASQPEVAFSSTPTLPQDEVVARLLFGRSTAQLGAGQALQVAQAVATLSGAGQATLGNLRRSLGLDTLDVGLNSAGTGGQIGLGRRLNDNISLGVRQGTTSGSTQATIDIDLGNNIRLQGATGADGGTSVGIGAQWDY
ncbi:translocation/assembly module TamB domain-containing protein [Aquabacter spiritensis]|uniref:translocation/assembly module TamB domain-containing protein n=1 Tax=Aquabacter spiritensis TaxID=933073 RepID=UPI001FE0C1AD|nr:translocation/assembly module TamB domain-containing protein [Aquabacter spiritensis]